MPNLVYNYGKKAILQGSLLLPIYIALVSNSYAPNDDTDIYRSSLTHIVTPSGYTSVFALSNPYFSVDTTANQAILFASNISIYNVSFGTSVRAAVLFGSTALGASSDPLIAYIDFISNQSVTNGTFNISWASGGVLALS